MLRRRKPVRSDGDDQGPVQQHVVVAVPRPRWHMVPFLISHLLAGALVGSWLWPNTRRIWDLYDAGTFRLLNVTLNANMWWPRAMAIANSRQADIVVAIVIGVLLLWNIRFYEKRCIFSGWFSIGVLAASVLMAKSLVCGAFVHGVCEFHRASPSCLVENCHRVTQIVPDVESKDSSRFSFPGDHGFVLICVALYLVYRGSSRQEMLAWLFVVAFGLPRLIVGADWATDIVVGSACVALVVTAWLMATPLHDRIVNGLCWRLANVFAGLFHGRAATA